MFMFFLRIALIGLVIYFAVQLVMGGYDQISYAYRWMRP